MPPPAPVVAAGGAGAVAPVAAEAPVVGGRPGTPAERQRVRTLGGALLTLYDERFIPAWLDTPTLKIAEALDVRTVFDNAGGFDAAMDLLAESDLVKAEEIAVQAPAAPAPANPFAAAQQAVPAQALSPFRREVRALQGRYGGLDPVAARTLDPLEFLRAFADDGNKIIPRCARTILAVPAQSVESERLFSLAGLVVNKLRNRLAPETAEAQILLSYWLRKDASIASVLPELRGGDKDSGAFLDFLVASLEGHEDADVEAAEDAAAASGSDSDSDSDGE